MPSIIDVDEYTRLRTGNAVAYQDVVATLLEYGFERHGEAFWRHSEHEIEIAGLLEGAVAYGKLKEVCTACIRARNLNDQKKRAGDPLPEWMQGSHPGFQARQQGDTVLLTANDDPQYSWEFTLAGAPDDRQRYLRESRSHELALRQLDDFRKTLVDFYGAEIILDGAHVTIRQPDLGYHAQFKRHGELLASIMKAVNACETHSEERLDRVIKLVDAGFTRKGSDDPSRYRLYHPDYGTVIVKTLGGVECPDHESDLAIRAMLQKIRDRQAAQLHETVAEAAPETEAVSYGRLLRRSREERGMTHAELADAAQIIREADEKITAWKVRYWEEGRDFPSRGQARAIEQVLIVEDPALRPEEIQERLERFRAAYDEAERARIRGDAQGPGDKREAFRELLARYRRDSGMQDDRAFASELRKAAGDVAAGASPPPLTTGQVEAVEAGEHLPEPHVAGAIMQALDDAKDLLPAEKQSLEEAYRRQPVVGEHTARIGKAGESHSARRQ